MRIDAHHHLWNFNEAEYGWISTEMQRLRRDFGLPELKTALKSAGIDACLAVQARQTVEETRWLISLAAEAGSPIAGVTGWLPLASPECDELLEELAEETLLKGVRHVVQDEPDPDFILGEDFNRGVDKLADAGLVYEILIFERQLPRTIEFVRRHRNQPLVLDHIGKPRIAAGELRPWADHIRSLGSFENLSCKLSGMITEADPENWSVEELRPYAETVLEAFGPERVMFGSDWPVSLLGAEYREWCAAAESLIAGLTPGEQKLIMGENARRIYHLEPKQSIRVKEQP